MSFLWLDLELSLASSTELLPLLLELEQEPTAPTQAICSLLASSQPPSSCLLSGPDKQREDRRQGCPPRGAAVFLLRGCLIPGGAEAGSFVRQSWVSTRHSRIQHWLLFDTRTFPPPIIHTAAGGDVLPSLHGSVLCRELQTCLHLSQCSPWAQRSHPAAGGICSSSQVCSQGTAAS